MCRELTSGYLARRLKPSWLSKKGNNIIISTAAFDLRDGVPPELFVSFYLTGNCNPIDFSYALELIKKGYRDSNVSGAICILNIEEALREVNDEQDPIIEFYELIDSPHCGLFFTEEKQELIQEAKTTLCFLARKRIRAIKDNIALKYEIPKIEAPTNPVLLTSKP